MKKLLALMLIAVFAFGFAGVLLAAQPATELDSDLKTEKTETEEFGQNFFMYLGGVLTLPVHVAEHAVRTLLFMDKE